MRPLGFHRDFFLCAEHQTISPNLLGVAGLPQSSHICADFASASWIASHTVGGAVFTENRSWPNFSLI